MKIIKKSTFLYRKFNAIIIDLKTLKKKEFEKLKLSEIAKKCNIDFEAMKKSFLSNYPRNYKNGIKKGQIIDLYFTNKNVSPVKILLEEIQVKP